MLSIRRCVCLGLFLAAAGLSAVAAQAQGSATGIAGVVVSKQSGQAVPDATVTVDGGSATATTNGAGRFRVNAPTGEIILVVKAPGFLDLRTAGIAVRAGETAQITVDLNPTPNYMERVQVTATKAPLSVGDVAAQTNIVDKAEIDSRGDQTLVQAIAHVPGAIVSTQLGVFESVMLRGMPRGDPEFTNTLLLVDGVPQTTSRNGSRVVGLTINDASNIEIVRGPNSALYGRTAIGGVGERQNRGSDRNAGTEHRPGRRTVRNGEGRRESLGPDFAVGRLLLLDRQGADRRLLQHEDRRRRRWTATSRASAS